MSRIFVDIAVDMVNLRQCLRSLLAIFRHTQASSGPELDSDQTGLFYDHHIGVLTRTSRSRYQVHIRVPM